MTKSQGFWIIGILLYILADVHALRSPNSWVVMIDAAGGLFFIIKAVVQNRKEESWVEDAQKAWQEASKKGDHC